MPEEGFGSGVGAVETSFDKSGSRDLERVLVLANALAQHPGNDARAHTIAHPWSRLCRAAKTAGVLGNHLVPVAGQLVEE